MKKEIPLLVLESLEKFVQLKGKQFEIVEPENFLVKVTDKDDNSNFYFNVEQYKTDSGYKLLIDYKPSSKQTVKNSRRWIEGKQLDTHFNIWVKLLEDYEKVNSFFDDPILKSFTEE